MNAQLTYELNRAHLHDLHRRAAEMRQARQAAIAGTGRRVTLSALRRPRPAAAGPGGAAPDPA